MAMLSKRQRNASKRINSVERENRRTLVADLYKKGYTYRQIKEKVMEELNLPTLSLRTIKLDIDAIIEEWKQERIANVDIQKTRELATLDSLLREAWDAWEKSKTDWKQKSARVEGNAKAKNPDGTEGKEITKFSQSDKEIKTFGNPRYLEVIIKILERKAKILGYETIPIELNGTITNVNENFDYSNLPTDILVEMATKLQDSLLSN